MAFSIKNNPHWRLYLSYVLVGPSEEAAPSLIQTLSQTAIRSQTELVEASHPLSRCPLLSSLILSLSLNLRLMKPSATSQKKGDRGDEAKSSKMVSELKSSISNDFSV